MIRLSRVDALMSLGKETRHDGEMTWNLNERGREDDIFLWEMVFDDSQTVIMLWDPIQSEDDPFSLNSLEVMALWDPIYGRRLAPLFPSFPSSPHPHAVESSQDDGR